jgi:hypothetical protein
MPVDRHSERARGVALTGLIGVRVRLGDRWVVVHRDDVELVFGDFDRRSESAQIAAERDRYRKALERLTDALADVRMSGMAARTYALHEAWKDAREALDA